MSTTTTYPHLELIQLCRSNNRQAQQQLYQLYAQPMFNVCYRIVNRQEEAEDVLQEAFVKMFQQIDTYRQESSFGAWFKRIVVNSALNHLKKEKRTAENIENLKNETQEVIFEEEVDSNLPSYSVNQIQDAMELLSEGYRVVFSLYLFEDYSHKEIANELGITESTSKSQLNRAKKKMRELLLNRYSRN